MTPTSSPSPPSSPIAVITDPIKDSPRNVPYKLVAEPSRTELPAPNDISARGSDFCTLWTEKWSSSVASKVEIIVSPFVLAMVMHVYLLYLQWHEVRTDVALARISDPFHPHLTAIDFSIPLFILAYGSLVLGAIHAANKPNLAIELIQKLSLVYLLRMFSLYIAPFEAPKGAIILRDPLAPGNAKPLERDLFFSGHTATTCIVFFTCRAGHLRWKIFFFIIAILTAFMVIVQKTHYVMDVWTAPFVVYGCHRMIIIIRSYFNAVYRYPLFKTKIED